MIRTCSIIQYCREISRKGCALLKMKFDLEQYCTIKTQSLMNLLGSRPDALHESGYVYIDNNAAVLAVAHADVHWRIEHVIRFEKSTAGHGDELIVKSPYLDDRLGIFTILETLPGLGINTDVLITTGEESGQSTANAFSENCAKKFNWIVEFDRKGEDVVLYEYSNKEMENELIQARFQIGFGTSSDIMHLKSLGIACFNVGIGYGREHYPGCWADLRILDRQIERFSVFYQRNKNKIFLDGA